MKFDEAYWSAKYQQQLMGWDTGSITTPLKEYIDQLEDKSTRILVPGCGNGHEVRYLHDQGFTKVTVIDLSAEPFKELREKCPDWSAESFIVGDFFDHTGQYDLIIEQTFFCALDPKLRQAYANKMFELLAPKGRLVGVLFNIPLNSTHPPFGGDKEDYAEFFTGQFDFKVFDQCYNSIKPRAGEELFINLVKPANPKAGT
jgi:methyl halide transferase